MTLLISYVVRFKLASATENNILSCIQIDSVYLTALVFSSLNTMWYLILSRVETASDQEWHKYLVIMGIDTLLQMCSVVATMAVTVV